MNYSTCLMALVASRLEELESQLDKSLRPHLQRLLDLATTLFGGRGISARGPATTQTDAVAPRRTSPSSVGLYRLTSAPMPSAWAVATTADSSR